MPTNQPTVAAAPKVSIIIPVLNKVAFTRKCIRALKRHTPSDLYEVIVWDNGSTDQTQAFLQRQLAEDKSVHYFRSEENLGFVGGNNAAVQHAHGEFLVFLNNDTEPRAGWLEALLQTAEADGSVGAVGAKLISANGRLQEAGGIIFRDASGWNYGRTQDPRDPRFNFSREVDYCSAACLLVRTALFRQLGGFDVRYSPAYYEDTDLCFALRHSGYRVVYQPRCEIIHHEGVTAGQDLTKGFKQYQVANRQKFAEKWKEALVRQSPADASVVRRASHRARGQRILVIDPLMPMHDRASGSKRLFEMLKLLAADRNAVTFVARNGQDGERYAAELQQLGIEVYAGDAERMREIGFTLKCWPLDLKQLLHDTQYDTVILSFWYVAEQYLPYIRDWSPKSRIVIDTVDVHFLRERRQAELYQDRKLLEQSVDHYRRELNIYIKADALITVTEDDRQALLKEIPLSQIFIVPNIHDLAGDVPPVDGRDGCLFVGGFGHPPNEDAVLHFHREIWPRILDRVPNARWTIVGNKPPVTVQALAGPAIEVTGYVPSMEPYLRSHLISIAPLRYGAGMKGKIGEALASGLPVVTTSIGAEGMGLQNGDGGTLVADDPEAFADHVARLYADRNLWNQLSAQGRQHIESHFTPHCIARQLKTILDWTSSFCSIIILTLNQWKLTKQCLDSILRHTSGSYELILVDNGSTDGTRDYLREYAAQHRRVIVVANRTNRGFAAGNNQGLALATGRQVLFLNNDTVVTPGWLGNMLKLFQEHPQTGVVGPRSNRVLGKQQVDGVGYKSLEELPAFAAAWAEKHTGESRVANRVVGFCLLARCEVINAVGGLDEQFGSGNFEDDDFCVRAHLAGFETRIADDSFVHHVGNATFTGAGIDYAKAMETNWGLFKSKWAIPPETPPFPGYLTPDVAPPGVALKMPLPELKLTHQPSANGRCWTDKQVIATAKAKPITFPPCALVGNLREARQFLEQKKLPAAWGATRAALKHRPFHPEAYLLLAEIALAAQDSVAARDCAQFARQIAPEFRPAKKFLKGKLHGHLKPEWLVMPEEIGRHKSESRNWLSVCLIVKNEERFLGQCLASVKGLAHQVVVVDTGSTDRTVEIAKEHGAQVHSFAWCDDFSAARNAVLEHATGDWVLMLDADEELLPEQHAALRKLLHTPAVISWRLPIQDVGREAEGCSYVPRLFRNAPGLFYTGRVHEQVFASLEGQRQEWGLETRLGDAKLRHYGYTKELTLERDKVGRNLRLLEQAILETPDDSNLLMNYGLELVRSGRQEEGLGQYRAAFEVMAALPDALVVPESREVLLVQFCTQLMVAKRHAEVVQVLLSPLAKLGGGLTASLHFTLGLALMELKQFAAAAEAFRQCLAKRDRPALTPVNLEIHKAGPRHCLARCLAQLGETDAAAEEFRLVLEGEPQARPVRHDYARFLAAHERQIEALNLFFALANEQPTEAQVWLEGGQLALTQPEFLEVALDWTAAAERNLPDHPEVVQQRAAAFLLAGQCAVALPLWRRWPPVSNHALAAALVLCETAVGENRFSPAANDEVAVSREFVAWYQRLLQFNVRATVDTVNANIARLERVLPSAAGVLASALAEATAEAPL